MISLPIALNFDGEFGHQIHRCHRDDYETRRHSETFRNARGKYRNATICRNRTWPVVHRVHATCAFSVSMLVLNQVIRIAQDDRCADS